MKKNVAVILGLIFFASISMFSKCEPEVDKSINCVVDGIISRDVVVDTIKKTKVTLYPVFTPSNHPMCDSMTYDPKRGAYVYPSMVYSFQKVCTVEEARDSLLAGNDSACPCRYNPDSAYNDDVNSYFHIGGIEKFPYNRLIIKTKDDTTALRIYTDYDNKNNLFIGEVAMNMDLGYYEWNNTKALATGEYEFALVVYKEEQHATQIGDTIFGNFAIVRSKTDANTNCKDQAFQKDDPLLR